MSLSRGCMVVRWTDNRWYAIVACEEHDYDYNTFQIFGHASTDEGAMNILSRYASNPGAYHVIKCKVQKDIGSDLAKAMRKFIKSGSKNPSFYRRALI